MSRNSERGEKLTALSPERGRILPFKSRPLLLNYYIVAFSKQCGVKARESYNTKDTFITIALSAGEDIGWIANSAGTFEQMIFKHYRKWIPNLTRRDGMAIMGVLHRWLP